MKIVTVVGARPQFIKAALISKVLKEKGIVEVIIHTGQHYDQNMSDIFFKQMNIPSPSYNLHVQEHSHGRMTGKMLSGIEDVLFIEKPDWVLVYGDTNSTLAGALAARKLNIKVAHVEGGLRNFDFSVPEDINRTLTDRLSNIIFCPTDTAIQNLYKEGFQEPNCKIVKTGDLMADSVKVFTEILERNPSLCDRVVKFLPKDGVLVTIHRQESTLPSILPDVLRFLNEVSKSFSIIFPIHPRTKRVISELNLTLSDTIHAIDPVGYVEMQYLLKNCAHVITDSGGLQKEAYLHKKKSLLLMNFTPWIELVENKFSLTTNLNYDDMISSFYKSLILEPDYTIKLYGDGESRYEIVDGLINF